MIYLYVYIIGFMEAMTLIRIADRTIFKNTERTSLSHSIATSLMSWIAVIIFSWMLLEESNFYKKLDKRWRK